MSSNKVSRINICVMLLKLFMESLRTMHCLWYKKTCQIIANILYNQRRSVISPYLLINEASKINTNVFCNTSFCILQQEPLSPLELCEPNHCSGLAPIITKVQLHHAHQRREDKISRRAPDVWRADRNVMSIVFYHYTV